MVFDCDVDDVVLFGEVDEFGGVEEVCVEYYFIVVD